jgi:hypothetical protein
LRGPSPESEKPAAAMTIYEPSNFEEIAAGIGVDVAQVTKHRNLFEAAARWYRLDRSRPTRTAPSHLRRKLARISKSAHRLLKHLGINHPDEAIDGPGDREILNALVLPGVPTEDAIIEATQRIGRFIEIVDGVAAVAKLDRRANTVANEVVELGRSTVPKGNPGDAAINDWIAAMMGLYRNITGNEPRMSVGAPAAPNEGIAGGPLIRFLEAAGKPLEIEFSGDAWRSRVRTILPSASEQN